MRLGPLGVLVSVLALFVVGCGPQVSDEELGRVVFEVPEIPEGHQPYELPSLVSPEAQPPDEPE